MSNNESVPLDSSTPNEQSSKSSRSKEKEKESDERLKSKWQADDRKKAEMLEHLAEAKLHWAEEESPREAAYQREKAANILLDAERLRVRAGDHRAADGDEKQAKTLRDSSVRGSSGRDSAQPSDLSQPAISESKQAASKRDAQRRETSQTPRDVRKKMDQKRGRQQPETSQRMKDTEKEGRNPSVYKQENRRRDITGKGTSENRTEERTIGSSADKSANEQDMKASEIDRIVRRGNRTGKEKMESQGRMNRTNFSDRHHKTSKEKTESQGHSNQTDLSSRNRVVIHKQSDSTTSFGDAVVTMGEPQVWSPSVPNGGYSANDVVAWANQIRDEPGRARQKFEDAFGTNQSPELLRQLAGWPEKSPDGDSQGSKAYKSALKMHLDLYDHYLSDASPQMGNLSRGFVQKVANLQELGAGQVKADVAMHILNRYKNVEGKEGTKDRRAMLEYTLHLDMLMDGPDADKMLLNLATDYNKDIEGLIKVPLKHDLPRFGGERVVGRLLAQTAVGLAKEAQLRSPDAQVQAKLLGRIVAHVEKAVYNLDYQTTEKTKQKEMSDIEHGARILRWFTIGVDVLTGGLTVPVSSKIRDAVDVEEDSEKSQVEKIKPERWKDQRDQFSDTIHRTFQRVLDPEDAHKSDPQFQRAVTDFRDNFSAGREQVLEEKTDHRFIRDSQDK